MPRLLVRIVLTVVIAVAVAHVFLTTTVDGAPFFATVADLPHYLLHFGLGVTSGGSCPLDDTPGRRVPIRTPGCSPYDPQTVAHLLRERLPVDLELLVGGFVFGTLAGVAAGRWCAVRPGTRISRTLFGAASVQLASPPYFQAYAVLMFFAWNSGRFRIPFVSGEGDYVSLGSDPLQHLKAMWVPWIVLGLPLAALVLRMTQASLREILGEDFLRTARAKGVSERKIIDRHALPVAAAPIAALAAASTATLFINVALIEYGFALPGMLRLIESAVRSHDVPVMQAMALEGILLLATANALADYLHARLDPRVRSS